MPKFFKQPIVKNVLSAVAVAGIGFILLGLTFLFDFLYQTLIRRIVMIFIPLNPEMDIYWFPPLMHGSFVVVIGLISWLIFRTKWHKLIKATCMTVPTAVALATLGIFLYNWPIAPFAVGALLVGGTLYYFYQTKQPWLYYYAVILVSLVLAIFTLTGGEI